DAIAADMGTVFAQAPNGFLDQEAGMRLRNEVYAVGGSRTAEESIRAFLGRERNQEAFLRSVGIEH
ncbi:MAG: M3 family metallopeptidase, partial [Planctomycetes bacterium]|nr:M3 family metallopeptidase [Planctomycetota bacterium]